MQSNKSHAIYVVEKGDSLWKIVESTFQTKSNAETATKLKAVKAANKHITNPDHLVPGDVVYLQVESPQPLEVNSNTLSEVTREFQGIDAYERTRLLNQWELYNVLALERLRPEGPAFVQDIRVTPRHLAAQVPQVSPISDFIVPYSRMTWRGFKGVVKTGFAATQGQFGNLLRANPMAWQHLNGELVRSLGNRVRYVKEGNNVLRMVSKNSRAFQMNGKVILVQPQASGYRSLVQSVKETKSLYKNLHSGVNKVNFGVKIGLSALNVADHWNTPERNRVLAKETGKIVVGTIVSKAATRLATHAVCGALTVTTGAGGVACYLVVYIAADYAASKAGEMLGEVIYDGVATPVQVVDDSCKVPK